MYLITLGDFANLTGSTVEQSKKYLDDNGLPYVQKFGTHWVSTEIVDSTFEKYLGQPQDAFYTPREAAERLGVHVRKIYYLIEHGDYEPPSFPGAHVNRRRIYIPKDDLDHLKQLMDPLESILERLVASHGLQRVQTALDKCSSD